MKEKERRMRDKNLFDKCMSAFPRKMEAFRSEFAHASARRDNAKVRRLIDKYCMLSLKVEPECVYRDGKGEV